MSIATTTAKVIKDAEKGGVDVNVIKMMSMNFQAQLYSLMSGASTTPTINLAAPGVPIPTTNVAGVPSTSSTGTQYLASTLRNKCVNCKDDLFCGNCGFI